MFSTPPLRTPTLRTWKAPCIPPAVLRLPTCDSVTVAHSCSFSWLGPLRCPTHTTDFYLIYIEILDLSRQQDTRRASGGAATSALSGYTERQRRNKVRAAMTGSRTYRLGLTVGAVPRSSPTLTCLTIWAFCFRFTRVFVHAMPHPSPHSITRPTPRSTPHSNPQPTPRLNPRLTPWAGPGDRAGDRAGAGTRPGTGLGQGLGYDLHSNPCSIPCSDVRPTL